MNGLKNTIKILFVILVLLFMIVLGGVSAYYYENWEKDVHEGDSKVAQFLAGTDRIERKVLKPNFTCLLLGREERQALTDFIMVVQYNPNTREVSLLSIPRDTNVGNASLDGKINSIYRNKYSGDIMKKVEEITGVKLQHFLAFNTKILREVVDAIDGVEVDVPFNMNYDDPYQNLYIHLQKGRQILSGKQAEQFVRYRSGYANADLGRISTQQQFIKALIAEVLKADKIVKVGDIVNIVLEGTTTDITHETIEEYLNDVLTFKSDRVRIESLPGSSRYAMSPNGYELSYFFYDEKDTKELVDDLFYGKGSSSGDTTIAEDNSTSQEVVSQELVVEDKIRLEVLNANSSKFNSLVEKLNQNECNVVKIGNYATTKIEDSRIIVYGSYSEEDLKKVKDLTGIKKIEESTENANVEFTIIIGEKY